MAGEVADGRVTVVGPGGEMCEVNRFGFAFRFGGAVFEGDVPRAIDGGEVGFGELGKSVGGFFGGVAEDDEGGAPRLERKGDGGAALADWKAAGVMAPVSGWKSSAVRPVMRKLASVSRGRAERLSTK